MTTEEVINDLKSRNEKEIQFKENGLIVSRHGNTINYWRIIKDKLVCIDCKTVY